MRATYLRVLEYLSTELPDDDVFSWILRETDARGIPRIQISPVQGRFLHLLAQLLGAHDILEIGTLGGFSGVWLARALTPGGRLITLEANPKHAALARETFQRAGVDDRVDLLVGSAHDTLAHLSLDRPLDMVFIDADKGSNWEYLQWARAHTRSGGIVVIDNVLVNGHVASPHPPGWFARTIADFNRRVFARYADATTIIPFFRPEEDMLDGMMIVRVS